MRPWLLPSAVAVLASAYPLVQVELDHAAPPRQTMQFTQRELMVGYQGEENSGTQLTWSFAWGSQLDSVPRSALAGLGIVCERDAYDCSSGSRRRGWVVVGLDTLHQPAMVDTLRARLDSLLRLPPDDSTRRSVVPAAMSQLDYQLLHTSRLRMVAVGGDAAKLAAEWNDGAHLVLAARLNAYRISWPADTLPGRTPYYSVSATPLPMSLYLPPPWAGMVRDSQGFGRQLYRVTVGIGRGWLPRVLEVRPDPAPRTFSDSLRLYGVESR